MFKRSPVARWSPCQLRATTHATSEDESGPEQARRPDDGLVPKLPLDLDHPEPKERPGADAQHDRHGRGPPGEQQLPSPSVVGQHRRAEGDPLDLVPVVGRLVDPAVDREQHPGADDLYDRLHLAPSRLTGPSGSPRREATRRSWRMFGLVPWPRPRRGRRGQALPQRGAAPRGQGLRPQDAPHARGCPLPCRMAGDCPAASVLPWAGPQLGESERARAAGCRGRQAPAGVRGWPRAARQRGPLRGVEGGAAPLTSLGPDAAGVRTRVCWRRRSRAGWHLARQTQRVCESAPFSLPVVGRALACPGAR